MSHKQIALGFMSILLTVACPAWGQSARDIMKASTSLRPQSQKESEGAGSHGGSNARTFDQMQIVYLLESYGGDASKARLKADLVHFINTARTALVAAQTSDKDAGYIL